MPGYRLNQGSMKVARTRMHHHTGFLVNHHQLVVFINHIDSDFFRFDTRFVTRTVEHQSNQIIRAHLIVALYRFTIDMDESGISSLLNTVTALTGHLISQVFIDADRILVCIHLHLPVLIEFISSFTRSSVSFLHLEFIIQFVHISCIIKPEVILYRSIYLIIYII